VCKSSLGDPVGSVPCSWAAVMTRITVLAADKPFGSSIVATATSREMAVTAVARGPSQHSGAHRSVKTLHGDMLDLTCPESLFDACDVLVVPLGSTEVHNVDFATDLHVATVHLDGYQRLRLKCHNKSGRVFENHLGGGRSASSGSGS